jgi:hypothetical protein
MTLQFKSNTRPGRNELCPCKSGLKFKKCHGDTVKITECNHAANLRMAQLIAEEQSKRNINTKEKTNADN